MKYDLIKFVQWVKPDDAQKFLMGIGGFSGFWFSVAVGGLDEGFLWLAVLMAIDYFTGIAAALKNGSWTSSVGFKGLFKKFFIVLAVAFCHGIDVATGTSMLRTMAIFAYAVNEAGSIIENIDELGLGKYIPGFLRSSLALLKEKHKI